MATSSTWGPCGGCLDGLRGTLEGEKSQQPKCCVSEHLVVEPDGAFAPLVLFCLLLLFLQLLHVVVKLVVDRIVPVDVVEAAQR